MDWLLLLLRLVLGLPQPQGSQPQPVAVRPDGTTTSLPPDATNFARCIRNWDWLTMFLPFDPRVPERRTSYEPASASDSIARLQLSHRFPPSRGDRSGCGPS